MAKTSDYSKLVAQAEKAVQGVKDPNLKSIAFQKVLEELLGGGGSRESGTRPTKPAKRARSTGGSKKAARSGPKAYVEEMIADDFFKKPKTITEVKIELENRGHHIPLTSLSGPLQRLCQEKQLRRSRAAGKGNKKTFVYSNY